LINWLIRILRRRFHIHCPIFGFIFVVFHLFFLGKPEGKRPLGRPRRRQVDNTKLDLLEIGWGGADWIGLAQDRNKWRALVNAVMNLQVP
jgi:hypothetical protein